jgi:hypothetical protein
VKNKKYPASKKSKMHNVWHPVKKKNYLAFKAGIYHPSGMG